MTPYTEDMTQEATYWGPGVNDGFGGLNFAGVTPILIKCRWEDKAVKFRNAQGQEVVSEAVVYVDRQVELGGWLFLGDQTGMGAGSDPRSLAGAREIRRVNSSPSLTGDEVLYKAML